MELAGNAKPIIDMEAHLITGQLLLRILSFEAFGGCCYCIVLFGVGIAGLTFSYR